MRYRIILCFLFTLHFSFFTFYLFAQGGHMYAPKPLEIRTSSTEVGLFLGGSYYAGDLNPSGHFNHIHPAVGVLYRKNYNPRMAIKGILSYGRISGNDASAKEESQRSRNLSFRSNIYEFAVEGEFNFLPYATGYKNFAATTPYVFAGIAVYHFNPMGMYQGSWHALQPLVTEGQGTVFTNIKTYSLTQFSIPFGVGAKINIDKRVGINLEWGLRKTFTDYLDDVSGMYVNPVFLASDKGVVAATLSDKSVSAEGGSNAGRQRGNSFTNDWYSFAGVIITFKLDGKAKCDAPH